MGGIQATSRLGIGNPRGAPAGPRGKGPAAIVAGAAPRGGGGCPAQPTITIDTIDTIDAINTTHIHDTQDVDGGRFSVGSANARTVSAISNDSRTVAVLG